MFGLLLADYQFLSLEFCVLSLDFLFFSLVFSLHLFLLI